MSKVYIVTLKKDGVTLGTEENQSPVKTAEALEQAIALVRKEHVFLTERTITDIGLDPEVFIDQMNKQRGDQ